MRLWGGCCWLRGCKCLDALAWSGRGLFGLQAIMRRITNAGEETPVELCSMGSQKEDCQKLKIWETMWSEITGSVGKRGNPISTYDPCTIDTIDQVASSL